MVKQVIDLGTVNDDGTGNSLKAGGAKINANFDEVYPALVPPGGTAGQILAKTSATNLDVGWVDAPSGGGSGVPIGGTIGQILTKASAVDGDVLWVDPPTGGGGGSRPTMVQVHRSTQQSIVTSTNTMIVFDATDIVDMSGVFDSVTNPTRLTVPAGITLVRVSACVVWENSSVDYRWARIRKNDLADIALEIQYAVNEAPQYPKTRWISVSPGDYFELQVRQQTGGSRFVAGDSNYGGPTWFCIELSN